LNRTAQTVRTASALAWLALAAAGIACHSPRPVTAENPVNVLVIMLDTVRVDRLSTYGYERPVSPHLDALAGEGVRFDRFFSSSSWTLPAHASLFTGLYPARHGATQENLELGREHVTLAERFAQAGYSTFAASSNSVVSEASGLARGYSEFVEAFRPAVYERFGGERHLNRAAFAEFLDERPRDHPFFAFLNFVEPHLPYNPPGPVRSRFLREGYAESDVERAVKLRMKDHYLLPAGLPPETLHILSDLYDAEIALLDGHLGSLIDDLRARQLLEGTLIVVLSDHGENLGDHGHLAHVFSIHNTLLHVPLVVRFPDGDLAGTVRADVAEIRDLYPTLLRYCGIPFEDRGYGRDLFAPDTGASGAVAVSEYYYPEQVLSIFSKDELTSRAGRFDRFRRRLRSAQDDRYKLVWDSTGKRSLFSVASGADEERDLAAEPGYTAIVVRLDGLLLDALGPPEDLTRDETLRGFDDRIEDEELIEQLRALGYVR
jgi:arylsulfatase A-like enzyme